MGNRDPHRSVSTAGCQIGVSAGGRKAKAGSDGGIYIFILFLAFRPAVAFLYGFPCEVGRYDSGRCADSSEDHAKNTLNLRRGDVHAGRVVVGEADG